MAIAAAIILFLFQRIVTMEERFFSVPLQIETTGRYLPVAPFPQSVRVHLRGEADNIDTILENDIKAYVDLRDRDAASTYEEPVLIRKTGTALNAEDIEIRVDPLTVELTIEEKMIKSLELSANIRGFPEPGYELDQYFLSPSRVEVEGPRSRVEPLDELETEAIPLNGRKEDFTTRVRIDLDDRSIRIRGGDYVEFRALIKEKIIHRSIENIDIVTLDLDPDYVLEEPLGQGNIQIQGSKNALEGLKAASIQLVVDCSEIETTGEYLLPVRPDIPAGPVVLSYEPRQVILKVVRPEEAP